MCVRKCVHVYPVCSVVEMKTWCLLVKQPGIIGYLMSTVCVLYKR